MINLCLILGLKNYFIIGYILLRVLRIDNFLKISAIFHAQLRPVNKLFLI